MFSLDILPPKSLEIRSEIRYEIRKVIKDCTEKYSVWGFKDPSTNLLYPVWASELPEHKLVIIYRSPSEIWQRYLTKSIRKAHRAPQGAWKFVKRWCEHNSRIISYTKQTSLDYLILNYQQLQTTQTEFDRFQKFVCQVELKDMRKSGLYHYQDKDLPLLDIAKKLVFYQTGYCLDDIFNELEYLRRSALN